MERQKIKSVIELAKYKMGDSLYWVVLRPVGVAGVKVPEGEEWVANCHPKVLFDRKFAGKIWRYRGRVPRLCAVDFQYVVDLLTSEPVVERFDIRGICRSFDTGEFYYVNEVGEWMPEPFLYTTAQSARAEKMRIKSLFTTWADQVSEDEV